MASQETATGAFRSGFVGIVGPANAGKSTLLNALLGAKVSIVSPKPQTTRTRVLGVKSGPGTQLVFLDSPGFLKKGFNQPLGRFLQQEAREVSEEGDICLLVVDGQKLSRQENELSELEAQLRKGGLKAPDVVAVNKVDLVDKAALLPLLDRLFQAFTAEGQTVEILPVSALKKIGLADLEKVLLQRLPEGPQYFPEDQLSDQAEETLAAEIVREKLFLNLQQELPYSVAVRTDRWEEEEEIIRIGATVLVERESQKGIVIGKGGEMLKRIGTAARLEMEKIFGTKVFLELFVRVEEDWTRSEKGLGRAGLRKY